MEIINKITNENEWRAVFPPKGGKKQWKTNHSALEFAKKVLCADFETDIKDNILNQLSNNTNFKIIEAIPEHITKIDNYRGGQRNHDMVLMAQNDNNEKIAICFEAKVKESFDITVTKKWQEGSKPNSKIRDRIKDIWKSISKLDWEDNTLNIIGEIRYQLLTGIIGTIKYAEEKEINKCVFCIYQMYISDNDKYPSLHEKEVNDLMKILNLKPKNNFLGLITYKNIECYILFLKRKI
jgi:hypothetical protein